MPSLRHQFDGKFYLSETEAAKSLTTLDLQHQQVIVIGRGRECGDGTNRILTRELIGPWVSRDTVDFWIGA